MSAPGGEAREPALHGGWMSVRVKPGTNRDGVVAALFAAGAQGVQELGEDLVTLLSDTTPADAVTCAVLAASPDAQVATAPAANVDWSEHLQGSVRAHDLGALVIVPPWLVSSVDAARSVVIDPGMAFGTGEHPTTRGVVRLLPAVVDGGERVADLGAGSAVLAIAAVKLGAGHAIAIEIDPDAIGNAEENVARNGMSARITVLEGAAEQLLPLVAPVGIVLANILSSVLISLLPTIASALTPDGVAILSGILREERDDMLAILQSSGWRVMQEDHEDVWWSVAIARR